MSKSPKLPLNISDEDLSSALMAEMDPARIQTLQGLFELYMKYGKAFVQAWGDMSGRLLASAAQRVEIAKAGPSLEEQGRLIGEHSVEGVAQAVGEYARFSHQCAILWASMSTAGMQQHSGGMPGGMPGMPPSGWEATPPAASRGQPAPHKGRGLGKARQKKSGAHE